MSKRSALGVVEGYYVAQAVLALHRGGVLKMLEAGRTAAQVAADADYDVEAATAVLEFVYLNTDLLVRAGNREYRLAPKYGAYRALGFHLDKFLGAYGQPMARLEDALRSPRQGRRLVDRKQLAEAFSRAQPDGLGALVEIVRGTGARSLLDLGCGTAALLRQLCRGDAGFRGWGVEVDREMCAVAVERIRAAGLQRQLRIIRGDARELDRSFSAAQRKRVDALLGGSLLNELCRGGGAPAVKFLTRLRRLFPGRPLLVLDYYGRLGRGRARPRHRQTLLQDLVQAVTGQGVPPADLAGWRALYLRAGCELVKAYEGEAAGIEWFLHVVELRAEAQSQ